MCRHSYKKYKLLHTFILKDKPVRVFEAHIYIYTYITYIYIYVYVLKVGNNSSLFIKALCEALSYK